VGHCGPDSSFLRITVSRAISGVKVLMVDDDAHLHRIIDEGVDLLLINRVLEFGFSTDSGVELIRSLHARNPTLKMMLVTNYPEVQAQAQQAGALPGFGKRDLGRPEATESLRNALGVSDHASPGASQQR
jgi:hypothetical protein